MPATQPRYVADLLAAKANEERCCFISDSSQLGATVLYREDGWLVVKRFEGNAVATARAIALVTVFEPSVFGRRQRRIGGLVRFCTRKQLMNTALVFRRRACRAFTLVELLVVIALVGALIAVLLPAVQRAREAANRSNCSNHLKQIGIALLNYHDIYGTFPPGYISGFDGAGDDTGPGWGWASMILPHLEQSPLHGRIQFGQSIEAPFQSAVRTASIATYLCPSDGASPMWTAVTRDSTGSPIAAICQVASANYVGVFGITEPGVDGEGVFFRNSAVALSEITDGASGTLLVGERSHRWSDSTWVGAVTNAELFPPADSPAVPFIENASGMILGHTFEGPPNAPGLECNDFSSQHADGANLLFCDGHVQFISASMEKRLFRALSTRSGGESTGGF